MIEHSRYGWYADGDAQNTLDTLSGAGIIDVQGKPLDDISEDAKDRQYFDQECEGIGDGMFITVHSLPHLERDMHIYLRTRIEPEFTVDGKFRPLELEYYGCLVGDGWALLVDRIPDRDDPEPNFRERVFDALGPGQCLWWFDKARTGQHTQTPGQTYDIMLQPAGSDEYLSLVISEPADRVKSIFNWMLDPTVSRNDPLWAGATLMICENWSGISQQYTTLNANGNPLH